LTARLQQLARLRQLTLSTIFQGAWALILSYRSRQDDVLFGTTVAGRPPELPGVESMIGNFINTVPLRVTTPAGERTLDCLRRVQAHHLAVRRYEHTPLTAIQACAGTPRGAALFETILAFQNYPADPLASGAADGLRAADFWSFDRNHYPIALAVFPETTVRLEMTYDATRFPAHWIAATLDLVEAACEAICSDPEAEIAAVKEALARADRQRKAEWERESRRLNRLNLGSSKRRPVAAATQEAIHDMSGTPRA